MLTVVNPGAPADRPALSPQLDCCGIANYTDWASTEFGSEGNRVPDSCCIEHSTGCGVGMAVKPEAEAAGTIYTHGCLFKLEEEVKENIVAVGGAGVGIAFLQVRGWREREGGTGNWMGWWDGWRL